MVKQLADLSFTVHGYTPGRFVMPQMVEFPFMGDSSEVTSVAFQRMYAKVPAFAEEHKGVKVLTVLASGFAETGPEGAARERALQQLVAGSGTRLLGPSSLGLVNPGNGLMLTANAMAHHKAEALDAGADVHIAKPVTPEQIAQITASLGGTYTRRNDGQPAEFEIGRAHV